MGVLVRGVGDGGSGREWKAGGALNVYMEDGKWGQGGVGWAGGLSMVVATGVEG